MLNSVRLRNFKCFVDSGTIQFGRSWTVIVGKNNAGKSALLSALSLKELPNVPYRGPSTDPTVWPSSHSTLEFECEVYGHELRRALLQLGQPFYWCIPTRGSEMLGKYPSEIEEQFKTLVTEGKVSVSGGMVPHNNFHNISISYNGKKIFPDSLSVRFDPQPSTGLFAFQNQNVGTPSDQHVVGWLNRAVGEKIYIFQAQRLNIDNSTVEPVEVLVPNGQNLAQVLNMLRERPVKYAEYIRQVRDIFPEVKEIVPSVISPGQVVVEVRYHEPSLDRRDLDFRLSECGIGITQVLCILYLVINSPEKRTIIIDEPNSFLHPGASKKLIAVLKRYPQHQYIFTTHSAELISACDPDKILAVEWAGDGSKVTEIDRKDISALRYALEGLGVSLSDVFGLDHVIWVEGPTEAECFPKLLAARGKRLRLGTGFVPLRTTGDITRKQAEAFFEIYRSIAELTPVFPTSLIFSLDSEELTDQQKEDLRKTSKGLVRFLPRRTFENYLLHSKAISDLLHELGEQIDSVIVDGFIAQKRGENIEVEWLNSANGANILRELFYSLTDGRQNYRKVEFGSKLIDWLLRNDPDHIADLSEYAERISGDAVQ